MKIYPAIDILGGKVVRLTRGDYSTAKQYYEDPLSVALKMQEDGAKYLHVVDLDGARRGDMCNCAIIEKIAARTLLKTEVGGGIRGAEAVKTYLDAGADRVILGTAAVKNYPFALEVNALYPGRIAVGVDARDGYVAVQGWEERTRLSGEEFCKKLAADGIYDVIYTDVACDGNMSGTNLDIYRRLVRIPGLRVTASGGVSGKGELRALRDMGADGVILGKALYEGLLDLKEVTEEFQCLQKG